MEEAWEAVVEAAYSLGTIFEPSYFPTEADRQYYLQCLDDYDRAVENNDRDRYWDELCEKEPGFEGCRIYDC